MHRLAAIARDERGVAAIEYALIASLIAIAAVGAMANLGVSVGDLWAGILQGVDDSM
jgi:Flp pilus assembly pilin Flp